MGRMKEKQTGGKEKNIDSTEEENVCKLSGTDGIKVRP